MSENLTSQEVMAYTTEIASAYLANHEVLIDDLSITLKKIFAAVAEISREANNLRRRPALTPAVAIEDSIQNDYIICLEDGKKLQMLKRHLNTVYNMSIEQYKERWGLPADYPVVAPDYAKRRSDIAKTTGLGSSGKRKNLKVA
ncbi:MAG: MucR family transcriptional regulator [Holosporales bacterium]|jgi:predicted transcriptional regulator|nr:MucR family transcriptional regulator [Holosporales bacterium]